jgi:hypothetical protein
MLKYKILILAMLSTLAVGLTLVPAHGDDMAGMDMGSDDHSSSGMGGMGGHMQKGEHMTMTELRPMTSNDAERGQEIIRTMREQLARYQDANAAIADGYVPYMPTIPQDVYHFANPARTKAEYEGSFNLAMPGSLLYEKKTFGGWKLVGAMYDAPADDSPDQLDKLIPLGLVRWHAHTNICLPQGVTLEDVFNGNVHVRQTAASAMARDGMGHFVDGEARARYGYLADARFGFTGTISDQATCEEADGTFHKQIFGWMVHVYPFASEDFKVAFSMNAP